jgi:hypothetical protein
MMQFDKTLAMAAGGGAVLGLLIGLAINAPGRALEAQEAARHEAAFTALAEGIDGMAYRIAAMDAHLDEIGVKARQIDGMVGALSAAFSHGDPKLLVLYERIDALERMLADAAGEPFATREARIHQAAD